MTILVIGKTGQVAQSLAATQPDAFPDVVFCSRENLNLAEPSTIQAKVEASGAKVIINAAAYTKVDQAEEEETLATTVNGESVEVLARAAKSLGAPLIHISTDYVFDGHLDRPYDESCPTQPLGAYGRSKLAGEVAALEAYAEGAVILRTAWVYSPYGHNFVKTMLRLGGARDTLNVVGDQRGNPSSALMIARAIWHILKVWQSEPKTGLGEVFHLAGSGSCSWFEFASSIFQRLEAQTGRKVAVGEITSDEFPTPAERPKNSRLESTRFIETFGFIPPPWEPSLNEVLAIIWKAKKQ